jgi:hypothetical protein
MVKRSHQSASSTYQSPYSPIKPQHSLQHNERPDESTHSGSSESHVPKNKKLSEVRENTVHQVEGDPIEELDPEKESAMELIFTREEEQSDFHSLFNDTPARGSSLTPSPPTTDLGSLPQPTASSPSRPSAPTPLQIELEPEPEPEISLPSSPPPLPSNSIMYEKPSLHHLNVAIQEYNRIINTYDSVIPSAYQILQAVFLSDKGYRDRVRRKGMEVVEMVKRDLRAFLQEREMPTAD